MKYLSYFDSPIGRLTLLSDGESVTYIKFSEENDAVRKDSIPCFDNVKSLLQRYFSGEIISYDRELFRPDCTDFQRKVLEETLKIPYGKTSTYGEIAKAISCSCARAVGRALNRNPIPIFIPCHRVIGKNGNLTGFAGGNNIKKYLIDFERRNINYELNDTEKHS